MFFAAPTPVAIEFQASALEALVFVEIFSTRYSQLGLKSIEPRSNRVSLTLSLGLFDSELHMLR